ncbi:glycosyltransferase [Georgenia ruanii]|uniref:Glycosyltransferase n=1 Tax=Georgenia ruanii TaxID=348442 RepID=A0A7J9UW18_9MICO|nr:glycosyltransferase [Georgenia ruanii]
MRRVLIAHPSPDLYGSDRQLLETVHGLVADGWHVDVVLPHEGPLSGLLVDRGAEVHVHTFPVLRKAMLTWPGLKELVRSAGPTAWRLQRLLRRRGADVAYINTVTIPIWFLAARLARTPAVCHVHEAEAHLPWPFRLALAAPLLMARQVVANSAATRSFLTRSVPVLAPRITTIHNGISSNAAPLPLRARQPADQLRLALIGRLSPRKGVHVALDAVALARSRGVDVRMDVCGTPFRGYEWYEHELRERAQQADLAGAVRFHGYVHPTEPILEAADAVLVPSFGESFGNAAVEGMLAGRPVIASRVQALTEILTDRRTGLLVQAGSAQALAEAIVDVAAHPALAQALAGAARAEALERFSVERYRDRVADVVASCRRARNSPADGVPSR